LHAELLQRCTSLLLLVGDVAACIVQLTPHVGLRAGDSLAQHTMAAAAQQALGSERCDAVEPC